MLKTDIDWPASFRYKSNSEREPIGFFSDALCNSNTFDIMLGFFSSAAINVLAYGFASFIYNGGKMRMIINDILSSDDISVISMANDGSNLPYFDLRDLDQLSTTLNKRDRHFFDCLAWMIRNDRIEIKVVRMVNGRGIAHTKCGTLSDGTNKVAFEGSVNFSLSALVHNRESLSVSCDWNGPADKSRIQDIQESFDNCFSGVETDVEFVSAESLKGYTLSHSSDKELSDILSEELKLLEDLDTSVLPSTVKEVLRKTKAKVLENVTKLKEEESRNMDLPHFPFPKGPKDYQVKAFELWKENDQRGFFAMATGTGKTVTSLNCLLEIYNRLGYYKAIIVVPTVALVDQWAVECHRFGFNNVVRIYSQSPSWTKEVADYEMLELLSKGKSSANYIFIVTYASLVKSNVYSRLFVFPKTQLLFIADEAHNMGSKQIGKLMNKIPFYRRIGLSATPKRQFDEVGNRQIARFFGFDEEKYTFTYSMAEAIDNEVLCKYFYYPHLVQLRDEELAQYIDLSSKIAKYMACNGEDFKDDPGLTALLIKRKRIVHKAANKQSMFKKILSDYYAQKKSLKYTLVYVPEGNNSDIDDEVKFDSFEEDREAEHLIDVYTKIVREIDLSITVAKFTAESKNRNELLTAFASGKLDVLTSMKCLDEGVDVPRSELAIFCASTGNPRQFIQRRGRILRKHKDKKYAVIHDLVVAPLLNSETSAFSVERNLLRSELKRVKDFAQLSENPTATLMELTPVLNHYNLNLYEDD